MLLNSLAFYPILGKPFIMWDGILVFLLFTFTFLIGYLNKRGINIIPIRWHFRMAWISVIFGALHGLLGILIFFGF